MAAALDIAPFRRSAPFFGALLLLAIPAFWPTYFFPKQYEADWHVHVHGIALFLLAHYRMHDSAPTFDQLYFLCVQIALMTIFSVAWIQAIRWRRAGGMHARYMVCTAIAMIDPILARILYNSTGRETSFTLEA